MPRLTRVRLCLITAVFVSFIGSGMSLAADVPSTQPSLRLPKIDRHPGPSQYRRPALAHIPQYNPKSTDAFQVDLRWQDLSHLDLRNELPNLLKSNFDTTTRWPDASRLPDGFDPAKILETGKNPGLGIRSLHARGITGKGVGIAIIDGCMLVDHQEYKDRIRLYEQMGIFPLMSSEMHGPAVASIAVGRSVGVAPEADLYYIATRFADFTPGQPPDFNFALAASAVRRIIEVNRPLPGDQKIRVISISVGWDKSQRGYDDITAAVNDAAKDGIFVISSSLAETFGQQFHGLGRSPTSDPDDFNVYTPGSWWASRYAKDQTFSNRLLVPMDCRTTAGPGATDEYAFYSQGGWSWSIPCLAGSYALACQVRRDVTPEQFWDSAMKTGRRVEYQRDGVALPLGPILDLPAALRLLQENHQ